MEEKFKAVLDSALATSVAGGLLYLLGVADSIGDSTATNLPSYLLRGDTFDTVVAGAYALLRLVAAPAFLYREDRLNSDLLIILLLFVASLIVLRFAIRSKRLALIVGLSWAVLLSVSATTTISAAITSSLIREARQCMNSQRCDKSKPVVVVRFEGVGDTAETRSGVLLFSNPRAVILVAKEGFSILNPERLLVADSAAPAAARTASAAN